MVFSANRGQVCSDVYDFTLLFVTATVNFCPIREIKIKLFIVFVVLSLFGLVSLIFDKIVVNLLMFVHSKSKMSKNLD